MGNILEDYIKSIRHYTPLSDSETKELWKTGITPDNRERVINSCLKMVVDMALEMIPNGWRDEHNIMDVIQAGNQGLIHATELFDHTQGVKFDTYAYKWIWQGIKNLADEKRFGIIRKPRYLMVQMNLVQTTETRLTQILERTPTNEELVVALDGILTLKQIEEAQKARNGIQEISLDAICAEDAKNSLGDITPDTRVDEDRAQTAKSELMEELITKFLKPKYQFVIRAAFGLGEFAGKTKTLEEINVLLQEKGLSKRSVTKERIRQYKENALDIIKTQIDIHPEYQKVMFR